MPQDHDSITLAAAAYEAETGGTPTPSGTGIPGPAERRFVDALLSAGYSGLQRVRVGQRVYYVYKNMAGGYARIGVEPFSEATMPPVPVATPPGELTISLPGPAAAAVARVLTETGDTPGAMVAKALGLYVLALDAKKRGKAVGSADSPDALETEFTGF